VFSRIRMTAMAAEIQNQSLLLKKSNEGKSPPAISELYRTIVSKPHVNRSKYMCFSINPINSSRIPLVNRFLVNKLLNFLYDIRSMKSHEF